MSRKSLNLKDILTPKRPLPRRRKRRWNPHRKRMGVIRKLRPFVSRSNRERASAVIRLRNRLRLEHHIYGGRFVGSSDILDPKRPVLYKQEAHVFFPGTDKRVFWNALIVTARKAFWDEVGSTASKRAGDMLPEKEEPFDIHELLEPATFNAWGQATSYRMREREEETHEAFNGMTEREYRAKLEKEIIATEPPQIYESFSIDDEYEYGIGLHVVVDAEQIDRVTVEHVIDRFFAHGEKEWKPDTPVDRERLPFEREWDALMTIPEHQR